MVFGTRSATAREPTIWNLEPNSYRFRKVNRKKMGSGKGGVKYSLHPPSGSRFCDREPVLHRRTWFRMGSMCTLSHARLVHVLWFRCYPTITFSRSIRFVGENHHQVVLNLSSISLFQHPEKKFSNCLRTFGLPI